MRCQRRAQTRPSAHTLAPAGSAVSLPRRWKFQDFYEHREQIVPKIRGIPMTYQWQEVRSNPSAVSTVLEALHSFKMIMGPLEPPMKEKQSTFGSLGAQSITEKLTSKSPEPTARGTRATRQWSQDGIKSDRSPKTALGVRYTFKANE